MGKDKNTDSLAGTIDPNDKRIGGKFWELRKTHGRNPIFSNPEQMWDDCCEYFQWVEDNPINEEKVFNASGEVLRTHVTKMRAMTINGLCVFLDIDQTTWAEYRKKEDFSSVTTRVDNIIYDQKFTGAAADQLNANIIARDLGLTDKKDVDVSASVVTAVTKTIIDPVKQVDDESKT